jgi:Tfp pilus assembly protein PilV
MSAKPEQHPSPVAAYGGTAGFGLLEVLVATALMGLVMVVLLQVLRSAMRCQVTSWSHTQAVLVADKVLQENCELNSLIEGTYKGETGRYKYVVRVASQYEVTEPMGPKRIMCSLIKVTVTWEECGRPMSLTLATVRTGGGGRS